MAMNKKMLGFAICAKVNIYFFIITTCMTVTFNTYFFYKSY